jgi:hypothetical protein
MSNCIGERAVGGDKKSGCQRGIVVVIETIPWTVVNAERIDGTTNTVKPHYEMFTATKHQSNVTIDELRHYTTCQQILSLQPSLNRVTRNEVICCRKKPGFGNCSAVKIFGFISAQIVLARVTPDEK